MPKISASSGLHHTVSSTRSRDQAPMCAVRIASDSTSRFSRSAAAALADSTAKSVRSATCSSRFASSGVHCRGVLSHITSTADQRAAAHERRADQRDDLHPRVGGARRRGIRQRVRPHVVDGDRASGLELADHQRAERLERITAGDGRQVARESARDVDGFGGDVDFAVRAARDVEVEADPRHDLAHDASPGPAARASHRECRPAAAALLRCGRRRSSHSLRDVMSRAVFEAPMMWP